MVYCRHSLVHFSHQNIIKYCDRPFSSVREHDEAIIKNWNFVVAPDDTVYHLGDFMFSQSVETVENMVKRLNGHIHLIYGNHDKKAVRRARGFASKSDYKRITVDDNKIVLFHYPIARWDCRFHGSIHLFGHTHGTYEPPKGDLAIDVGVDNNNYTPISYSDVIDKIDEIRRSKKNTE